MLDGTAKNRKCDWYAFALPYMLYVCYCDGIVFALANDSSLVSVSVSDSDSISTSKDLKDIGGKNLDQQKSKPIDPEIDKVWAACLVQIKLNIMPLYFQKYFETIHIHSFEDDTLTLAVPNQYTRKCLIETYRGMIENCLKEIYGKGLLVDFCIAPP